MAMNSRVEDASLARDLRAVAPALDQYRERRLFGDLWNRPALTARDRRVVTVAALIVRNQTIELPYYINLALESGLAAREISDIITHLAFYSGWASAMGAVAAAEDDVAAIRDGWLRIAEGNAYRLRDAADAHRAIESRGTRGKLFLTP
jgi:4-carboxymuconolactone decarboxylase